MSDSEKPLLTNSERPAYPTNGRMHSEMIGLSKRELFAMAAMQGLLQSVFSSLPMYEYQLKDWREKYGDVIVRTAIAKDSIELADELLKQLES